MKKAILLICLFFCSMYAGAESIAPASEYQENGEIIGRRSNFQVGSDDSLPEIARQFDIGYKAITAANPEVDPFVPDPKSNITIPCEWILPDVNIKNGIVINIAEMRLYLFQGKGKRKVATLPVGIGDQGKDTPVGTFSVVEKIKSPAWHVPKSILKEKSYLPPVIPPGPNNPMGSHALRLSNQTVLIHGTDRPWGIGTRDSHGCIRLYQEDIAKLFSLVARGARVTIVNQPVKAAVKDGVVYLEVHDYEDGRDLYEEALKVLEKKKLFSLVDPNMVRKATSERSGLLEPVNKRPGPDTSSELTLNNQ